ncbi:PREDICTED: E3 ubiquitin-protein ligase HUWE1-like, partial [Priapulus caudatus]|uniref:E3 ubiquitin-protein ligase HUWE1-like n=1 Tax=Priapulus caudatus TaxID=37621 RepID=A0ABM1F2I3_PRICU
MKIDRSKLKKSSSEVPQDCKSLIEKLKECSSGDELLEHINNVKTWNFGKCELYHWIDILDHFDSILENACAKASDTAWILSCDKAGNAQGKALLLHVLHFTALLIEHSFSRHLYNSMEHLTTLLASSDMAVALAVLNLLYVFSKRSNFITRLAADRKQALLARLTHLAESWGGLGIRSMERVLCGSRETKKSCIHMDAVDRILSLPSSIMEDALLQRYSVPADKQVSMRRGRHCCGVPADKQIRSRPEAERLLEWVAVLLLLLLDTLEVVSQSLRLLDLRVIGCRLFPIRDSISSLRLPHRSYTVYSNALQDNLNSVLYNGFIEELVDVLGLRDAALMEIRAASLRTLTSIIHLDRNPKLNTIIDATGASSYHGFLPTLVRSCIHHMTVPGMTPFPQPFATALFSFLYHLASYES